jgi:hypothetical protein
MPFGTLGLNAALDGLDESIAAGAAYVGIATLVTAPPTDTTPGTGTTAAATEATGGSPAYARKAATWGPASGGTKTTTAGLTFDVPAGTYGFFTFWNASSGNSGTQYLGYSVFRGASPKVGFGSVAAADVTNDTITSPAHGLANGDRVIAFNTLGATIPAGLTEGAAYYVVGAATDTFQVSTTSGGSAVNLTGEGVVYWEKVVPEVFASQGQITVASGQLTLDLTTI